MGPFRVRSALRDGAPSDPKMRHSRCAKRVLPSGVSTYRCDLIYEKQL